MAKRFIEELSPGERIDDEVFLISSKDLRSASNGSLYIHAVLADRTGRINSRLWQASQAIYENIPEGGFLRFKGRTESYKGNLQFIIDAMRPVDPKTIDIGDFLPHTEHDVDEMFKQVKGILRTIKSKPLLGLIKAFLEDEDIVAGFKSAPAAMQLHHAYVGGLLEHTLKVLELAELVTPHYPEVNRDVVLAGVFLHDIGKAKELTCDTSFAYTDQGQLIGHIAIAVNWIEQKARQVEQETGESFPDRLKWALQHVVLSHHGQYEFGSPKLPAMPEAILVHYLDNIDAKLHQFLKNIEAAPADESHWTGFNRALNTRIFKPRTFDEE